MPTTRTAAITAAITTLVATHAHAGIHSGDVILTVEDNAIVTNTVNGPDTEPNRAFVADLAFIAGFWSATNPGFDCDPGTFSPSQSIGFVFEDELREWNGADFDTISNEQIAYTFGPAGPVFSPTMPDTEIVGFDIPIQSNGGWHKHYDHFLIGPGDPGIYLLRLRLTYTGAIEDSEPFYFLYNQSQDIADVTDALAYVNNNLLSSGCPEDINNDNVIDTADLGILLGVFGTNDPAADLNNDNIVDTADLGILLGQFGLTCS